MPRKEIKLTAFVCSRCGYEWIPKDPEKPPEHCPNVKCHSPYWDKPRVRVHWIKRVKEKRAKKGRASSSQVYNDFTPSSEIHRGQKHKLI